MAAFAGKGLGCSFGHRVGITVDEDRRPERIRLERSFRHIGSGNDLLHHPLIEHIQVWPSWYDAAGSARSLGHQVGTGVDEERRPE